MLRSHPILGLAIGALVVVADQITKWLSITSFETDPITVVPGLLWFVHTENPGAAFSFFQDGGSVLAVVAMVAAVVVTVALFSPRPRWEAIAFGLVLGGAVGNLIDRLTRGEGLLDGAVVDWIQVPDFPVFNLADSAITVAVVFLLVMTFRTGRSEQHRRREAADESLVDGPQP